MKEQYIISPMNYVGGKGKILNQILPYFPDNIERFYDVFVGGGNVFVNAKAKSYVINDLDSNVMSLHIALYLFTEEEFISRLNSLIEEYQLNKDNEEGFKRLRDDFNRCIQSDLDLAKAILEKDKDKNYLKKWEEINNRDVEIKRNKTFLFYLLICYSYNHQIRYNSKGFFNNPFGRNRGGFSETLKTKLIKFMQALKDKQITFSSQEYGKLLQEATANDFVYLDPPYIITDATYNKSWNEESEVELYRQLDLLTDRGVKWALSNVSHHKGKENQILKAWMVKYNVKYIDYDYRNSSYNTLNRSKTGSCEILVLNYEK